MSKVLKFEDFIKENEAFNMLFNDTSTFIMTKSHKKVLYETILNNCDLNLNESRNLERILNEETLYEGLFSKISDKAKEIIGKVTDELKKAGKELITGITNDTKKAANSSKDDLIKKVKGMGGKTKETLAEESKNISDTFNFYTKFATSGIAKLAETAYQQTFKVIKSEDSKNESFSIYDEAVFYALIETIKSKNYSLLELNNNLDESIKYLSKYTLNESGDEHGHHGVEIPFLNTIKKFLQKAPIFKQLSQLEEKATDIAKNTLHKASAFAKALGGPGVFEFLVLATLIGAVTEVAIKQAVYNQAITFVLPGIASILTVIKWVALALTCVAVVQHILKGDDDEHEKDKH